MRNFNLILLLEWQTVDESTLVVVGSQVIEENRILRRK